MKFFILLSIVFVLAGCSDPEYRNQLAHCKSLQFVEEDTCLQRLALEYGTSGPCESIRQSGVRIPCIVEVAKRTCDTNICNSISESWQRPYCETAVTNQVQCTMQ